MQRIRNCRTFHPKRDFLHHNPKIQGGTETRVIVRAIGYEWIQK